MKKRITNIFIFILVLWLLKVIDSLFALNLSQFSIVPRTIRGLLGITFAPLLHANYYHLISNTVPIFVLLFLLFTFYKKHAIMVILESVIIGGILVWIFARSASHIGISGLIYSLAAFLIMAGLLKKDTKSILLSVLILFLYGGLVWGVFPGKFWISWEGHLFGALAGVFIAFVYFKKDKAEEIS